MCSPSVALRASPPGRFTTRSFSQFRTQQQQKINSLSSRCAFSTSTTRSAAGKQTMGQLKSRQRNGPFSWKAALLFVATGAAMIIYFRVEKARLERKRVTEMSKGVGRPKVGGPFVLKDLEGKEFTAEDLKGKYSFVRTLFLNGEKKKKEMGREC
jgi:protein SCO1/2